MHSEWVKWNNFYHERSCSCFLTHFLLPLSLFASPRRQGNFFLYCCRSFAQVKQQVYLSEWSVTHLTLSHPERHLKVYSSDGRFLRPSAVVACACTQHTECDSPVRCVYRWVFRLPLTFLCQVNMHLRSHESVRSSLDCIKLHQFNSTTHYNTQVTHTCSWSVFVRGIEMHFHVNSKCICPPASLDIR